MKKFIYIILIVFAGFAVKQYFAQWQVREKFRVNITESRGEIDPSENQDSLQKGHVIVPGVPVPLTEKWIRNYVAGTKEMTPDHFFAWRWNSAGPVTASACGIDRLHHFANSYLTGILPFQTDSVWEPVYAVALMKSYQYDHLQYSGLADVWQNSRQAFCFPRGDCEDHSIILADWLISSGYDARVAIGLYRGGGHAWVILFKDKTAYLLEATSKRKKITEGLRPAFLETDYNPSFQFNRTDFWVKTDKKRTTRYSGTHWEKTSEFVKD